MRNDRLENSQAAGLLRRLAAMLYDGILLFAVLFFAALVIILPFNITYEHSLYSVFILYIYAISFLFLGWSWTRTGQTLGMKTWRLYLHGSEGNLISWKQALNRFASVLAFWVPAVTTYYLSPQFFQKYSWLTLIPVAIDYLSCLIDSEKRALHDIISGTRLTMKKEAKT